ncbi:unnamed protein product [Caenorhabditis angaria]|uniref:Uncharacterized protein n=1 Tax=Caenorhabditis angaria TaxID=860376 RepID=A0A9P1ID80_9PELO|nr:unnamed protein product [Caenorhabditis angaria]
MLLLPLIFGVAQAYLDGTKELLFVQTLWRHGDRSPTKTFKTDAFQEGNWTFGGGGWGQLSPLGMEQHLNLGKRIRARYVDKMGFYPKKYDSKQIYVRSTDVNRTLISAMSNLLGQYGQDDGSSMAGIDYPAVAGWPKGFVPIPVHTVPDETDHLGNVDSDCALQDQAWALAKTSVEVAAFINAPDFQNLLGNLSKNCGQEVNIDNLWIIANAFFIEQIYYNDTLRTANPWFTDEMYATLDAYNDQVQLFNNGIFATNPNMVNGIDVGLLLRKIRGGPILNDIAMHMNLKLACAGKTTSNCTWINNLKNYVYSVHDTTIYAFFSALLIETKAVKPAAGSYPQYSACVQIELYRDTKDQQAYFKMLYHDKAGDDFDVITSELDGCPAGQDYCSLSVLQGFADQTKPDLPNDQYCDSSLYTQYSSRSGITVACLSHPRHQFATSQWLLKHAIRSFLPITLYYSNYSLHKNEMIKKKYRLIFIFAILIGETLQKPTTDASFNTFCDKVGGQTTEATDFEGTECKVMWKFETTDEDAAWHCKNMAPYPVKSAKLESKHPECVYINVYSCADGYTQIHAHCYKIITEELMDYNAAFGECAAKNQQLVNLFDIDLIRLFELYFAELKAIWLTPRSDNFDGEDIAYTGDNNEQHYAVVYGMAAHYNVGPGSLIRANINSRAQVMCVYRAPETALSFDLKAKMLAPYYFAHVRHADVAVLRTANQFSFTKYSTYSAAIEYCQKSLKAFTNTVAISVWQPTLVNAENMRKSDVKTSLNFAYAPVYSCCYETIDRDRYGNYIRTNYHARITYYYAASSSTSCNAMPSMTSSLYSYTSQSHYGHCAERKADFLFFAENPSSYDIMEIRNAHEAPVLCTVY